MHDHEEEIKKSEAQAANLLQPNHSGVAKQTTQGAAPEKALQPGEPTAANDTQVDSHGEQESADANVNREEPNTPGDALSKEENKNRLAGAKSEDEHAEGLYAHEMREPEPSESKSPQVPGSDVGPFEAVSTPMPGGETTRPLERDPTNSASQASFDLTPQIPLPHYEETQECLAARDGSEVPTTFLGRIVNFVSWLILIVFFAGLVVALLYYRYAADRLYNIQFDENRTIVLTVAPGDRLANIIEKMRAEGLLRSYMGIDDAYLMRYLAWINENSHKIKSGVYRLNSSMSLKEIYDKLIAGSQDFKVTIPEGKTARETAAIIKRKLEKFSEERFLELVNDPEFISKLGLKVPSLEGYLYPDTYFFAPSTKEEDIVRMMVENFIKRAEASLKTIEKTEPEDKLSFHEHVIIASLIEREARLDAERPLIASVIFNRLKKGMKLEIDATVNYALGEWGKKLTYDDLKTSSSYNTYLHAGLPPGPICNPRIESLIATFQPEKTDYLFYVYKGDGTHAFAKTYEEHLANIKLYRKGAAVTPSATASPSSSNVVDLYTPPSGDELSSPQNVVRESETPISPVKEAAGESAEKNNKNQQTKPTKKSSGRR